MRRRSQHGENKTEKFRNENKQWQRENLDCANATEWKQHSKKFYMIPLRGLQSMRQPTSLLLETGVAVSTEYFGKELKKYKWRIHQQWEKGCHATSSSFNRLSSRHGNINMEKERWQREVEWIVELKSMLKQANQLG